MRKLNIANGTSSTSQSIDIQNAKLLYLVEIKHKEIMLWETSETLAKKEASIKAFNVAIWVDFC